MVWSETQIVRKLLAENKLDAETALSALIHSLVDHHLKRGGDEGGEATGLTAVVEALMDEQQFNHRYAEEHDRDDEPDDGAWLMGMMCGGLAQVQVKLLHLLTACRDAGEAEAQREREEAQILADAGLAPQPESMPSASKPPGPNLPGPKSPTPATRKGSRGKPVQFGPPPSTPPPHMRLVE